MTATSGKWLGVGTRRIRLFPLNASGTPAAVGTTVYEGLHLVGGQTVNFNLPEPVRITHIGDSRIQQLDMLPPKEAITLDLTAARLDFDIFATLTGTKVRTLGDAVYTMIGTDHAGDEPQVGMLVYQQALSEAGVRKWRAVYVPKATILPLPKGFDDEPSSHRYVVTPQIVSYHLWGELMTESVDGGSMGQLVQAMYHYKPHLVSFLADGVEDDFLFHQDRQAINANYVVFENGVEKTSGITKTTDKVTYAVAPAANKRIDVVYESAYD